jgi:hypothetical protein
VKGKVVGVLLAPMVKQVLRGTSVFQDFKIFFLNIQGSRRNSPFYTYKVLSVIKKRKRSMRLRVG